MKRFFVLPYLGILFILAVYAIYQAVVANTFLWLAVLLAIVPMLAFMSNIMLSGKGRTREHLYPEMLGGLAGSLIVFSFGAVGLGIACFVLGVLGVAAYDFWYSDLQRTESDELSVGAKLPEFTLFDTEGQEQPSSMFTSKPAVWMFIRGNWCPLCVAQIKEVSSQYRRLQEKGVEMLVITPQPEKQTKALSNKFDVPMHFMVDKANAAANKLGIAHVGGVPAGMPGYGEDTVFPTILITDGNGEIIYSDQTANYRVRPEPDAFLSVIEEKL